MRFVCFGVNGKHTHTHFCFGNRFNAWDAKGQRMPLPFGVSQFKREYTTDYHTHDTNSNSNNADEIRLLLSENKRKQESLSQTKTMKIDPFFPRYRPLLGPSKGWCDEHSDSHRRYTRLDIFRFHLGPRTCQFHVTHTAGRPSPFFPKMSHHLSFFVLTKLVEILFQISGAFFYISVSINCVHFHGNPPIE